MGKEIKSTCCYCGVGCGLLITTEQGRIADVRGDPDHPANRGRLCTKGASLAMTVDPEYRLLAPEGRSVRGKQGIRMPWDQALDEAASRFASIIREYGPDSVAFYVSGQLMTEDYYVFNKLAKGLVGTNNIDTNSRLCMSSAVSAYKQTLGVDAPPCCYDDIDHAGLILIAGANPAVAHPIVFRRIEEAKKANPALKIIVIDPRRTETAELADLHLSLNPGTDIALFNGMLQVMINEGRVNREYVAAQTSDFDQLAKLVADYTPDVVAQLCGVDSADLVRAARWFAQSKASLSLYCQGLNQSAHGTHNNAGLIHLHLATGQIGRAGAGPFSLTGQPNAMGGREVGGLCNLLSAHRDLSNADHRAEVAAFWGLPAVPEKPGKSAVDLFKALKTGEIKAVWIACTNPAQSLPNQAAVREALSAAEYVVLQEAFGNTDTAAYADLLLPATTWGEKEGTVTNSERCITRVLPAVAPPGDARHDWQIVVDFACRLGDRLGKADAAKLFPYRRVEDIFNEHRESTRGRDLDITGLSYALLESRGPQQWPFPEGAERGRARLYEDGCFPTADGRARFLPIVHQSVHDATSEEYPVSLLSGRMRDHWHGMSRTGTAARLFNLEDEPLLAMHPCDMRHRNLSSGGIAQVSNARGKMTVRVVEQAGLKKGRAWVPMHWGSQFMNSPGANAVACDALDPYSLQPELKHAAVQITRLDLSYPLAILRQCDSQAGALALLQKFRVRMGDFPYATVSLYGRQSPVVVFRAASAAAISDKVLAELDTLAEMDGTEGAIDFVDVSRRVSKRALLRDKQLVGVRLAGETRAQRWLKQAIAEGELDASLIRFALAPTDHPPASFVPRNIVCKCADVSDTQIEQELARGGGLGAVQEALKCGTFCGACVPDLKRMASACANAVASAA